MIDILRFAAAALLFIAGIGCAAVSILGVFRFHFVMNRMQCAAILDTAAMLCILVGLMLASGSMTYVPKLIAVLLVLWIGSPIASHLVSRMEMATDETAIDHIRLEEDDTHGHI